MKKLETVGEMQHAAEELRAQGKTIALVPTSGALHEGHVALIRAAKAKAELEYDRYRAFLDAQPRLVDADFEKVAKELKKLPAPRAGKKKS